MPQGAPRSGEKYRHFKNKLYQVLTIARHSETGEELVIYQALYGDYGVYARPLSMFVSEVDRAKYPEAKQRFRFELAQVENKPFAAETEKTEETWKVPPRKTMEELLMDFYDARSYGEKYQILLDMQEDITNVMINNMAVVLDLVIDEGPLEQRFEELKRCLKTCNQYEARRIG